MTENLRFKLALCLLALMCVLLAHGTASATPLFAMQAAERCDTCHEMPDRKDPKWVEENYKISERKCGLTCNVCHVNPSGGMLRNDTGMSYGTKTLPWQSDVPQDAREFVKAIRANKYLTFGGDFRFLAFTREGGDTNPLFFPMQGDMYMKAAPTKHVTFFSQFGLERGGNSAVREVFGMVESLPYNAYVKAGKFLPPYGLKLDDHTAYVRSKLNFDQSQASSYVSGYEAGAAPLVFFARAAEFNADSTPANSTATKTAQGYSATAGWQGIWLHLNLSYLDINNMESSATGSTDRKAYGAAGALRFKTLSYLFEWDRRRDTILSNSVITKEAAVISFNELDWRVHRGLNLKARYETYNPDRRSGEAKLRRYTAGADFYPYPFTELNLQYRIVRQDDPHSINNEALLLAHIWF